jgi:3-isopropylmalate/(R)-2-methylmalate dehydratase small subunit
MLIKNRAFVFGDYIDTDLIYPGIYLGCFDPQMMAKHAMEGFDPEFFGKIQGGGILVAGKSFGIGSAREQAAASLKYAGVNCVAAQSFARSFFRNAVNVGLPLITLPEGVGWIEEGDHLEIDIEKALAKNLTTGEEHRGVPLPFLVWEILFAGGAVSYFKNRI